MTANYPTPVTAQNFHLFMEQEVSSLNQFEPSKMEPLYRNLCFLVAANDGWVVSGWGYIMVGLGGHQQGLHQNEAFTLIDLYGVFKGLELAGVPAMKLFHDNYLTPYVRALEEKQAAMDAANASVPS
jgi:hypothetical protein